jgi:hypothetical protein
VCTVLEPASVTEYSEQHVLPWLMHLTALDAVLPKLVLVTLVAGLIAAYLHHLVQIVYTEVIPKIELP